MKMDITVSEALTGFQRVVTTLDKREIVITSKLGEVIQFGEVKCVMDEGMPIYRDPFTKGRLVIRFKIEFPPSNWCSHENLKKKMMKIQDTHVACNVKLNDFDCRHIFSSLSSSQLYLRFRNNFFFDIFESVFKSGFFLVCKMK